ncbi:MAG: hypothetical protein E7514_04950 [Ruminococcaceae bacterium]|nr:hypothetical protein [Oscillospiraceae bacterium]
MQQIHTKSVDRLFEALGTLKTKDEFYAFFEDICTITELKDIAQRLDTAFLLNEGMNYQTISKTVGISTATIGRVSKCLNYGSGGYKLVIDRLNNSEAQDEA